MSVSLLKCAKFEVIRRDVPRRDGGVAHREIIVHPGAVVVLPILDDGRWVMIRNYRDTVDRELLELPAGTLDVPGEDQVAAAHRELEEETGYRAAAMSEFCAFYPSPGILTELIRAYVATGLTRHEQRLDPSERIRVEIVEPRDAMARLDRGEIQDAKSLIAMLIWARRNGGRP